MDTGAVVDQAKALMPSVEYVMTVVNGSNGSYAVNGVNPSNPGASTTITMYNRNTIIFNLDHESNGPTQPGGGFPLLMSQVYDGTHTSGGSLYENGVGYTYINGTLTPVNLTVGSHSTDYVALFNIAGNSTTRRLSFTPTSTGTYYYFCPNFPSLGGAIDVVTSGNAYAGISDPNFPLVSTCTATSDGVSQAVNLAWTEGNNLVINMTGTLSPGILAKITCNDVIDVHGSPGSVSFTAVTESDTVPITGQVGYTILDTTQVTWISAALTTSYVSGAATGDLTVKFAPSNALGAGESITITPSRTVWSGDGATTCVLKSGGHTKLVATATVSGAVLTLTLGIDAMVYIDIPAEVTCSSNLAVNGAAGAVTFAIQTTTDSTALSGQTGYTVVASDSVTWGSAELVDCYGGGCYVTTRNGGVLKVIFTPSTTITGGAIVTLTASQNIFETPGASAGCTAVSDSSSVSFTTVSGSATVTATLVGTLKAGFPVTMRCTTNLANNGAVGAVTFSISTTSDTTAITSQTGFAITAADVVTWIGASRSASVVTGMPPGDLLIRFVPSNAMFGSSGIITITPSVAIFSGDGPMTCTLYSGGVKKANPTGLVTTGILRVTVGDTILPYVEVLVRCSTNFAVNGPTGPVSFGIRTNTDSTNLPSQVGYIVVATNSLAWNGAVISKQAISGKKSGGLEFSLTPATSLGGGKLTLMASRPVWVGDNLAFAVPDTFKPIVASLNPLQGDLDVDITDNFVLMYSEKVFPGTGNIELIPSLRTTLSFQETSGDYWIDQNHKPTLTMKTNGVYDLDLSHETNDDYPVIVANHTNGIMSAAGKIMLSGEANLGGITVTQFATIASIGTSWKAAMVAGLTAVISLVPSSASIKRHVAIPNGVKIFYTVDTDLTPFYLTKANDTASLIETWVNSASFLSVLNGQLVGSGVTISSSSIASPPTLSGHPLSSAHGVQYLIEGISKTFDFWRSTNFAYSNKRVLRFAPPSAGTYYYYHVNDKSMGGVITVNHEAFNIVTIASNDPQVSYTTLPGSYGHDLGVVTINPTNPLSDAGATEASLVVTYAIKMPEGLIVDAHGNSYIGLQGDGRLNNDYLVEVDSTPPTVTAFNPATSSISVPSDTNISITFNELIQAGSGDIVLTPFRGSAKHIPVIDSQVTITGDTVLIRPNTTLVTGLLYTTTAPAGIFKDRSNNPYKGLFDEGHLHALHYFTVADVTAPEIWGFYPKQDEPNAAISTNIVISFNEPIQAGVGTIYLSPVNTTCSGSSCAGVVAISSADTTQVDYEGNGVTITPASSLEYGKIYEVSMVNNVIRDDHPSGNSFPGLKPTACTLMSGGNSLSLLYSTYGNGTLNISTLIDIPMGQEATISCSSPGEDINADLGSVVFGIHTTTNPSALSAQAGYTIESESTIIWGYAERTDSLVQTVQPGSLIVTFTPRNTLPSAGAVTITPSINTFNADGAITCTATSDGVAQVVSAASTLGAVLTVTLGGVLTGNKVAVVTCTDNMVNNPAGGPVTFGIYSSTDTAVQSGLTGYLVMPMAIGAWVSATRDSYRAATDGGSLYLRFKPNSGVFNSNSITITASTQIFTADIATSCSLTSTKVGDAPENIPILGSSAGVGGTSLTITVGGTPLMAGRVATVECTSNLANNPAQGTVITFSLVTTTDTFTLAGQTGYTTEHQLQVTWISGVRSLSHVSGAVPGDLVVSFTPTTLLSATGTITVTPSSNIFTSDGAINCTLTGNTVDVPILSANTVGAVLTVTISGALPGLASAILTCNDNLAVNGGAGAVTFSIATSADTSAVTGKTGYTIVVTNAVQWGSATRGNTLQHGQSGGALLIKFTPTAVVPVGGLVTITTSKRLFLDTYRFTIPLDTAPPVITSYNPVIGGTGVDVKDNIYLNFDEAVLVGTGSITLTPSLGNAAVIPINDAQITVVQNLLTINPAIHMSSGVEYTVTMPSGIIQDTAGNDFPGISGSDYTFSPSECTYHLPATNGFICNITGCFVKVEPIGAVCGKAGVTDILTYQAHPRAAAILQNVSVYATANNITIQIVQTHPLGIRVGVANGLQWPEYLE